MADAAQQKARRDLRRAQTNFEREVGETHAERLASFKRAQKAGLSLREIAQRSTYTGPSLGALATRSDTPRRFGENDVNLPIVVHPAVVRRPF
jgi:hypothetical protein